MGAVLHSEEEGRSSDEVGRECSSSTPQTLHAATVPQHVDGIRLSVHLINSSDSDPDQTCHFTSFAFHLELVEIQKGLPSE